MNQKVQAERAYRRLFRSIAHSLGLPSGTSPPELVFVPPGRGYTTSGVDNWGEPIKVWINPSAAHQLALPPDSQGYKAARFAILHEFGRVFGPTSAYQAGDGNTGAGWANEFANHALRFLNGKVDEHHFARWCRANVPQYGKDPSTLTIPEPGSTPPPTSPPPPPPTPPPSMTPAGTHLDRRATQMSTPALERVIRNGSAEGGLRTAAGAVLRQRRAGSRAKKGQHQDHKFKHR